MAQHNEILEGGLNHLIAVRLAMQGGAPSPVVSPELTPVLTLEVDRPEWGFPKAEQLMMGYATSVAVAAQYSTAAISNPLATGTLIVVERIETNCAVGTQWHRGVATAGTLGVSGPRDFRWAQPGNALNSVAQLNYTSNVALPTINPLRLPNTTGVLIYQEPIILPPGTSLQIWANTVNTAVTLNLSWRERALLPGELV